MHPNKLGEVLRHEDDAILGALPLDDAHGALGHVDVGRLAAGRLRDARRRFPEDAEEQLIARVLLVDRAEESPELGPGEHVRHAP